MFFYEVSAWEVNLLLIIDYFIYNNLIINTLRKINLIPLFTNKRDQWKKYLVVGCCF